MYGRVVTEVVTGNAVMKLTDIAIRNLKPGDKDNNIADDKGLYLRVYKSGSKAFFFRSRSKDSAGWKKLGDFPGMSLADARVAAAAAAKDAKVPVSERVVIPTLKDFCDSAAVKRHLASLKNQENFRYHLTKYLLPVFGTRRINDIKRPEMSAFFDALAERVPTTANHVLTTTKTIFNLAEMRGLVERSPVDKLTRKTVGGRPVRRDRVLSDDDIRKFYAEIASDRFGDATRLAFALLLLTGQRSGEVRGLRKAEVVDNFWVIPDDRTKNGVASKVPRTRLISKVLEWAFNELGDAPFEGMDINVLPRAMTRMAWTTRTTPHDLRRTMATRMADLGVMPHIVEKCLNHMMTGVMAIYNHAEYLPEKKAAYRLWCRYLLALRKKKAPGEPGA